MPAVSVITPAWNAADHIGETIASVRAQTVADWELVVVDDGSTDDTASIVAACAAEDPRIRLIRQDVNAGVAAGRNRAIRASRGRFLAILDADDVWHPGFLQAQLEVFARHPDTSLVTANGLYLGGPFHGMPARPLADGFPVLTLEDILANERAVFIMTTFRREVFDAIGGFNESQRSSEDYDYWIRATSAGLVLRRNPRPLAWYRVRGDSLSANRTRMLRSILVTLDRARPQCAPGSTARAVLEAQAARFEAELLLEEGKVALARGEFTAAAARLRALRARGGGRLVAATAWLAEHAPALAALGYRARRWAPRWLRARAVPARGRFSGAPV